MSFPSVRRATSRLPIVHLSYPLNLITLPAHNPSDLFPQPIYIRKAEDLGSHPPIREALTDRLNDAVVDAVLGPALFEEVIVELGDLSNATERALVWDTSHRARACRTDFCPSPFPRYGSRFRSMTSLTSETPHW